MNFVKCIILCSAILSFDQNAVAQSSSNSKTIKNRIEQSFTIEKTRKDIRIVGDGTIAKPQLELKDEIIRLPASPAASAQKNDAKQRLQEIESMEERHYKKPLILSAGSFQSDDKLVRIGNIIPTNADKMCQSENGDWPCGIHARSALRRLVRSNTIRCVSPNGVKNIDGRLIEESCEATNFEIGIWLITQGWADSNHADHTQLRDNAKAKGLGIWRK